MTRHDAAKILGLPESANAQVVNEVYEKQRVALEAKLERAPTENLKEKYRAALDTLARARALALEATSSSADNLPVVRRSPAAAPTVPPDSDLTSAARSAPSALPTARRHGLKLAGAIAGLVVLACGGLFVLQRPTAGSQRRAAEDRARAETFEAENLTLRSDAGESMAPSTSELIEYGSRFLQKRAWAAEAAQRCQTSALERRTRAIQLQPGTREHAQLIIEAEALERWARDLERLSINQDLEKAYRAFTASDPAGRRDVGPLQNAVDAFRALELDEEAVLRVGTLLIVTSNPTDLPVEIESRYGDGHKLVIQGRTPIMEYGFFGKGPGEVRVMRTLARDRREPVTLGDGFGSTRVHATWP